MGDDFANHRSIIRRLEAGESKRDRSRSRGMILGRVCSLLPRLLVRSVFPLAAAVLFHFQPVCSPGFLLNAIVPVPAGGAFQPNILTHDETAPPLRRALSERSPGLFCFQAWLSRRPIEPTNVHGAACRRTDWAGQPTAPPASRPGNGTPRSRPTVGMIEGHPSRRPRDPGPHPIIALTPGSWSRHRRRRSCPPRGWRNGGFPPWRSANAARRSS